MLCRVRLLDQVRQSFALGKDAILKKLQNVPREGAPRFAHSPCARA